MCDHMTGAWKQNETKNGATKGNNQGQGELYPFPVGHGHSTLSFPHYDCEEAGCPKQQKEAHTVEATVRYRVEGALGNHPRRYLKFSLN